MLPRGFWPSAHYPLRYRLVYTRTCASAESAGGGRVRHQPGAWLASRPLQAAADALVDAATLPASKYRRLGAPRPGVADAAPNYNPSTFVQPAIGLCR